MFSAYLLDPEFGWVSVHRLPLEGAITHCREYKKRVAGSLVAIVPDGKEPWSYLMQVEAFCGG